MNFVRIVCMGVAAFSFACAAESSPSSPTADDDSQVGQAEFQGVAQVGRKAYAALRAVAPNVTLSMLGEDDGDPCTASFRTGPASALSAQEVLRLYQFNVEKQLASNTFSFQTKDPRDSGFWQEFIESQDDEAAAKKVAAIFSGPDVIGLATMVADDNKAFSAPVYLVALMSDKSLVALRGTVGGMGFEPADLRQTAAGSRCKQLALETAE